MRHMRVAYMFALPSICMPYMCTSYICMSYICIPYIRMPYIRMPYTCMPDVLSHMSYTYPVLISLPNACSQRLQPIPHKCMPVTYAGAASVHSKMM
jgi:hypothetical protein